MERKKTKNLNSTISLLHGLGKAAKEKEEKAKAERIANAMKMFGGDDEKLAKVLER